MSIEPSPKESLFRNLDRKLTTYYLLNLIFNINITYVLRRPYHEKIVDKDNIVVQVVSVLVPGAYLALYQKTLGDYAASTLPNQCHLVSRRRTLRARISTTASSSQDEYTWDQTTTMEVDDLLNDTQSNDISDTSPWDESTSIDPDNAPGISQSIDESFTDSDSYRTGKDLLDPLVADLSWIVDDPSSKPLRSRVLQDVWHALRRIDVPMKHGLRLEFQRILTDTIMVMDKTDVARVTAYLERSGQSFEQVYRTKKAWILTRVRRVIPPPEELTDEVYRVLMLFGLLKCKTSGKPLFDKQCWKAAANFLKLVRSGQVSDPPNVSLYHPRGYDKHGLPLYRCSRGTNSLEGGVHQNIIRSFNSFGASPQLACALLMEYRQRHNLKVSR